jgi:excisionase family DNA binding protein
MESNQIRLLKSKDAAAYLAVSERTLWNLTKFRHIPAVQIGRAVRYDIADLDSFISESKEGQFLNGTSK